MAQVSVTLLLFLAVVAAVAWSAYGQDDFNLEDAFDDIPTQKPKPAPKPPKVPTHDTGDFDLSDIFDTPQPTKRPAKKPGVFIPTKKPSRVTAKPPKKPGPGDFDLSDALDDRNDPNKGGSTIRDKDKPNGGRDGGISDSDLEDILDGGYKPDKGKGGGRGSSGGAGGNDNSGGGRGSAGGAGGNDNYDNSVTDLKICWRSCQDKFRTEMKQKGKTISCARQKRPYTNHLMFLRDVLDLCLTGDNLDDVEDKENTGGNSSTSATPTMESAMQAQLLYQASPNTSQAQSPPSAEAPVVSCPTSSRQKGAPHPLHKVEKRVMEFLIQSQSEDDVETFLRSLAPYLRTVPLERLLRTQAALTIVLEAAAPPNDPAEVFTALEKWRLFGHTTGKPPASAPPRP